MANNAMPLAQDPRAENLKTAALCSSSGETKITKACATGSQADGCACTCAKYTQVSLEPRNDGSDATTQGAVTLGFGDTCAIQAQLHAQACAHFLLPQWPDHTVTGLWAKHARCLPRPNQVVAKRQPVLSSRSKLRMTQKPGTLMRMHVRMLARMAVSLKQCNAGLHCISQHEPSLYWIRRASHVLSSNKCKRTAFCHCC